MRHWRQKRRQLWRRLSRSAFFFFWRYLALFGADGAFSASSLRAASRTAKSDPRER